MRSGLSCKVRTARSRAKVGVYMRIWILYRIYIYTYQRNYRNWSFRILPMEATSTAPAWFPLLSGPESKAGMEAVMFGAPVGSKSHFLLHQIWEFLRIYCKKNVTLGAIWPSTHQITRTSALAISFETISRRFLSLNATTGANPDQSGPWRLVSLIYNFKRTCVWNRESRYSRTMWSIPRFIEWHEFHVIPHMNDNLGYVFPRFCGVQTGATRGRQADTAVVPWSVPTCLPVKKKSVQKLWLFPELEESIV
jgi:hypothetical protein